MMNWIEKLREWLSLLIEIREKRVRAQNQRSNLIKRVIKENMNDNREGKQINV